MIINFINLGLDAQMIFFVPLKSNNFPRLYLAVDVPGQYSLSYTVCSLNTLFFLKPLFFILGETFLEL